MWGIQSTLNHKHKVDGILHNIEVGLRVHYDQIRRKQWKEILLRIQREYYRSYVQPRGAVKVTGCKKPWRLPFMLRIR